LIPDILFLKKRKVKKRKANLALSGFSRDLLKAISTECHAVQQVFPFALCWLIARHFHQGIRT
jgi:hypothetical protein